MKDIDYWNNFYNNNNTYNKPSQFCLFIIDYLNNNYIKPKNILDAGCGNGRDSYELSKYFNVTGIDNSGFIPNNIINCNFINDNFVTYDKNNFDLIYSRFTFHSITNEDHNVFLKSINNGSYLCIETRSDKDYNKEHIHGNTHYRNYTNINYIYNLLINNNFEIIFIKEDINFAKYKEENPYCIRIICKKK